MTPKREKILWIVYALVLVVLFLVSSTDIIMKEKETEVYPVSIIIDDTTDDYYVNFRKGAEQAAIDYYADVSFITLYDKTKARQQLEMVSREQNDGARAVILSPLEDGGLLLALDETMINGPFVVINSAVSHVKISYNITKDYYEAGRTLAEKAARKTLSHTPIYLVTESMEKSANTMIYEGVMSVLEEGGYETRLTEAKNEGDFQNLLEEMKENQTEPVLIGLDVESLTGVTQLLGEQGGAGTGVKGVYGFGSTLLILNYLDEGVIDGLIVTNDFIRGYLSVQKAVEAIQNVGVHETVEIPFYYVEKEDIRKKEFQKILYPID